MNLRSYLAHSGAFYPDAGLQRKGFRCCDILYLFNGILISFEVQ